MSFYFWRFLFCSRSSLLHNEELIFVLDRGEMWGTLTPCLLLEYRDISMTGIEGSCGTECFKRFWISICHHSPTYWSRGIHPGAIFAIKSRRGCQICLKCVFMDCLEGDLKISLFAEGREVWNHFGKKGLLFLFRGSRIFFKLPQNLLNGYW